MVDILGTGLVLCIAIVVVMIVVFLVFWFILKVVIEFFPSVVLAGLTFWVTGDIGLALVVFIVSAIIFWIIGRAYRARKRPVYYR
jgi:hypothetical protein